ncbi:uncharacterized protein LOC127534824 isoform X2 [Acanthochromis polyacanthus]|uniref:uncharacterized protein LOC127534824 isoform X2 n=1 Tax=Acanthochromis polyacanthus TaxID=80966 RepID=UPI0022340CC5|nr:uncharacterized protein LOC127534824 isoform X2 [Acanthochromis polyacanthus]
MAGGVSREIQHLRTDRITEVQQYKMAGLCFVIQKASSTLISITELTFIFLLWFVPELSLCSPVTAGVNGNVQIFYCEGCAPNVTKVFCNDENLLDHSHIIPKCSGPPQPNSVCQRNGSVFASTNTSGVCEFEGENHIETKKCPGPYNICCFNGSTSSSPVSPHGLKATEHIVIGVVGKFSLQLVVHAPYLSCMWEST